MTTACAVRSAEPVSGSACRVYIPIQTPFEQTNGQRADETHSPLALHVSTPFPLQRVLPGEHAPVQTPFEQTNGQAVRVLQVPLALHVLTPLPSHSVAPGTHSPVQVPFEQTNAHGADDTGMPGCQVT
ncbi:MAG TPA: hypothetical protein VJT73_04225, partial [Polyangiaceae bacterium]|nr:hypothetical protein [Polyangiaceae bacterium]